MLDKIFDLFITIVIIYNDHINLIYMRIRFVDASANSNADNK